MAANWVNVRYVGTTPISVNFKTWYPNEIHAMPEGQLEEFKRIHGDVLVVLGPNKGDVPGEGPGEMPKGTPIESAVPEAGTPPVQGEPRTSNEPDQPVEPDQSARGKTSKGGK